MRWASWLIHLNFILRNCREEGTLTGRGFWAHSRVLGMSGPVCVEVEEREFEGSLELRKRALALSLAHLRPLFAFDAG